MFGLGSGELVVIFLIIFLLFGPKALPEITKGLVGMMRFFKRETKSIVEEISLDDEEKKNDLSQKDEQLKQHGDTSNDFDPSHVRRDWRPKNNSEG